MKKITLLFPGSYMDYRKIDEDMQEEYRAAVETGLYHTILFNYDEWVAGGSLRMTEREASSETYCAVYRGWMLKPEDYLRLFEELSDKGIRLLTTPREYDNLHLFPNVYPFIKKDTAGMIYFADGKVDVDAVKKKFRRFMVKDSVKSVKGTEFPAFFGQDITQAEFNDWMQVFYKYRGDLMTGGICIKEYLDLKRYADRTNEFRAFMQTIRSSVYAGIPFSRITQKCRPQTLLKDTAVFPVLIIRLTMLSLWTAHGRFWKPVTAAYQACHPGRNLLFITGLCTMRFQGACLISSLSTEEKKGVEPMGARN